MLKRRTAFWVAPLILSILVVVPIIHSPALSADYPTKTIECVIPWNPGSASDMGIRMIIKFAEKELGKPIAPINKVGGNGDICWRYLSKAKPDGYTIGLVTFDIQTNQVMGSEAKYDGLYYIIQFTHQPMGLYVHKDSPFKTVQDYVDGVKAKPGQIKVATTSLGGLLHQAGYLLDKKYGIKPNYVPFKGTGQILSQQLGKHVDASISTITKQAPHVKVGTLRMLMTFSDRRLPDYPDVPNIKELGVADVGFESWRAVAVPKGVPRKIQNTLRKAFKAAYDNPEYQSLAKKSKFDLLYRENKDIIKFLRKQYPMVKKNLKEMGFAK
jgi:tripartite-type tricarboxylate transporter receptor subunit TctC